MEDVLEVYARPRDCLTSKQNAAHGPRLGQSDIARLFLMRRIPKTLPREDELWRYRALGAVIPDLDDFDVGNVEACPPREIRSCRFAFPLKPRGSSG
jgi:hypothetical protein